MLRRRLLCSLLAPLLLVAPASAAVSQAPDVTDTRYTSVLEHVVPVVAGVTWRVIDRNDEIELVNHSGRTVTVYGYAQSPANVAYDGGPYARILGDGAVEVNENSPAYYLNGSFFADYAHVPASASASARPRWVTLARNGTYYWHDHRIHYTSPVTPQSVTTRGVGIRQLVFAWYVPIQVGTARGALYGKLFWNGQSGSSFPIGAIIALIVVVSGGAAFVVIARRRRRGGGPTSEREVW
jgi:hypothetical protein